MSVSVRTMTTTGRARRALGATAAALLAAALGVTTAGPASADYNVFTDPAGDWGTTQASDVIAYGVDLTPDYLYFVFQTRASLSIPLPGSAGVIVEVETTGDQSTDYLVFMDDGGASWRVREARSFAQVCDAYGEMTYNTASFVADAGCFGTPGKVKVSFSVSAAGGIDFTPDDVLRTYSPSTGSGPDVAPTDNAQQVVYRFWSPGFNNAHFFTTNEVEAAHVALYDDNWIYEGSAFGAVAASGERCNEGAPIYRFYSPVFQSHFYTQSAAEKEHVRLNDPNWSYEGVAYCAYTLSTHPAGSMPLYRFWSPVFGKHFFTANGSERDQLDYNDPNWDYEGIAYYVVPLS